ncbi:methionine ABC transporter permease [Sharpea azabuensis]|uniref:D-methionine transport system permease protein n=1 Tax=Sharpea azabuensis TaxID=322505 RepID=A0A1H6T7D6_9FIRM|nr:methionine ABC transporter permease [Sharpea azabuensis]MDD6513461.1 ABC transporter permease [Sharpea azabuensis]MEE3308092.1 methionine ABC transporter permease [Sharpea azabuensis]SEI76003.1 D-methionine transport system permease protein [Sharpea azabuensis]SFE19060.1 D-methionine transport system permease protein [Sharpea azabuensis]SFL04818.1 D-methionine transport system permease protein [Sharpea azabuensis]
MNSMSLTEILSIIGPETVNTLIMVIVSTVLGYVFGIPLGIVLTLTDERGLKPNKTIYFILDFIVNVFRSIPFIILLVWILPFTRAIVHTTLGVPGAIVPLTVSAIPFIARMIEQSLKEVDPGVIEAAKSMGASTFQIVIHVLLVEARSSLVLGTTIVFASIVGYAAMAGTVGAGGLGDVAIRYGYQRYIASMMYASIIVTVIIVQLFQLVGNYLAKRVDKR